MSIKLPNLFSLIVFCLPFFSVGHTKNELIKRPGSHIPVQPCLVGFYAFEEDILTNNAIANILVNSNHSIGSTNPNLPSDPYIGDTFVFNGWMTTDYKTWDLDNDIVRNGMTLIAKWKFAGNIDLFNYNAKNQFPTEYQYYSQHSKLSKYVYKYGLEKSISSREEYADQIEKKMIDSYSYDESFLSNDLYRINSNNDNLRFSKQELNDAIQSVHPDYSYPGCGIIAMTGVLDYLWTKNYIDQDYTDQDERTQLIKDLSNCATSHLMPIGLVNQSTGKYDSIYISPRSFVYTFNKYMNNNNMGDFINSKIYSYSRFNYNTEEFIGILKDKIKSDFAPVTVYQIDNVPEALIQQSFNPNQSVSNNPTSVNNSYMEFRNHYFNVYGYETWTWEDEHGDEKEETFFYANLNWGLDTSSEYAVFSEKLFNSSYACGFITYDLVENEEDIHLTDEPFSSFVNANGNGQYFNYNVNQFYNYPNLGMTIYTNRLRCSYIENNYLVLSSNRINTTDGLSYLDLRFNRQISTLSFNLSLWGADEALGSIGDYIKLYAKNDVDSSWTLIDQIEIYELPNDKDDDGLIVSNDLYGFKRFKIEVKKNIPDRTWNRGRIVIKGVTIYYEN